MNACRWHVQAMRLICYFTLAVVVAACSPDHGLGPTTQGISGTVTFVGTWPDSIIEARVVVLKHFPPASVLDIAGYSGTITPGTITYDYLIELPPEAYPFIGTVCRAGPSWDERSLQCILGFFGTVSPETTEVEPGKMLSEIDIEVNFGE